MAKMAVMTTKGGDDKEISKPELAMAGNDGWGNVAGGMP